MTNFINVYGKCFLFRVCSIIIVRTFFVPDEFYQSLEPAHHIAFGYGYLTWEFTQCVRSWTYPLLFAFIYKLLALLNVDYAFTVVFMPRLFQAALTAFGDCCFFKISQRLGVSNRDIWSCIVYDWFSFYCGSRTIINTFENNLVTFGLASFYNAQFSKSRQFWGARWFSALVVVICFVRPTSCLAWGPFCLLHFVKTNGKINFLRPFLEVGSVLSLLFMLIDSYFYGKFVFSPWNFVKFNIFNNISSFYGSHPIHWYMTQGIPVVLGAQIIPFVFQVKETFGDIVSRKKTANDFNMLLIASILSALLTLSIVPHKEFRFLFPLVPMMKFLAVQKFHVMHRGWGKVLKWTLAISFVVPVSIFGLFHKIGMISVIERLAETDLNENSYLLFLTPCHATPLYSHLHINVHTRFLTCEPPLTPYHIDESDVFYSDPKSWLTHYFDENTPSHIIMFDSLSRSLGDELATRNYSLYKRIFNTIFPEDRVGSYIEIYRNDQYR